MRRLLLLLAALLAWRGAAAEERIDLATRPGVMQPVYATVAARPTATVILFPGGEGVYAAVRGNFLVRIAPDLSRQGLTVFIADAPSDQAGGMSRPFRASAEHATDIKAIIALAKTRSPAPVWLIGTSNGSISAANGAASAGKQIAGVVLTSAVWARGMGAVPLERIVVPVLVVHNRDDGCQASPFAGVEGGMARLTGAPVHQLVAVSGGILRSDACQGLSPHGYLGIEQSVVPPIVDWIRRH
jgi:predicted alpha/beta-fold hydrolase